jgi:hypothetical protein
MLGTKIAQSYVQWLQEERHRPEPKHGKVVHQSLNFKWSSLLVKDSHWLTEVTEVHYLVFINIYGFSNCILQNIELLYII